MAAPQTLILIHIPKTAGTTLSHMLRLHLGAWPPTRWLHHGRTLGYYHLGYARPEHMAARLARIEALAPAQRRQVRFFAAHAGFGLRERLPADMREHAGYLAVLRDPVARFVSTFHHLRAEGRLPSGCSLHQYLDMRKHFGLFKFDNAQTRYLAGEGGVALDSPVGTLPPEALETAKRRLEHELSWFGVTERFDESVVLLADMLGWRKPRYVRARVTSRRDAEALHIDEQALRMIREFNAMDANLYEHAAGLLQRRIDAAGSEFPGRVTRFRGANARHARVMAPLTGAMPAMRRMLQRAGVLR